MNPIDGNVKEQHRLSASLERERQLQTVGLEQPPVREDFPRWSVSDDPPLTDHDAAPANIKDQIKVMRGNDLGVGETLQQRDQMPSLPGIQHGGRFVHRENVRLHGHHRGDRDSALLSGRKMVRRLVPERKSVDHG